MHWYFMVLKKYITFNGRSQRTEYWCFLLSNTIIILLLTLIDIMIGIYNFNNGIGLTFVYLLLTIIPTLAVLTRRLHDTNRSAWWIFILLIPIIGLVVLITFLVEDSHEENEYGLNPKAISLLDKEVISEIERISFLKNKGIIID